MTRPRVLAAILIVILLVTVRPWYGFVGHSHWANVEWVPFSHGVRPFDCVANVLLFVPLGAALTWGRFGGGEAPLPGGRSPWKSPRAAIVQATIAGALLSMAVELYQVYCHGHFPTMTDVLTNTTGAWLGAWFGASTSRSRP